MFGALGGLTGALVRDYLERTRDADATVKTQPMTKKLLLAAAALIGLFLLIESMKTLRTYFESQHDLHIHNFVYAIPIVAYAGAAAGFLMQLFRRPMPRDGE